MEPQKFVDDLLKKLRSPELTFFPIRHHSPACAAHVARWITEHQPVSVLIEGPESLTGKVELLVDGRCLSPVAFFTNFIDRKRRSLPQDVAAELSDGFEPPRFSAFYPLCDYSPELVALRVGHAAGARIRFIDLEYPEKVLAAIPDPGSMPSVKRESLTNDSHLRHSDYIQELARRTGCRDFNELWDHLFESGHESLSTDGFVDQIAAWCAMARLGYSDRALADDGTAARENCMAAAINDELAKNREENRSGPVLVVTGGFHTVALPDLVQTRPSRPKKPAFGEDETGVWLIRYSFDQLDALSGYVSGMPSPQFYQRMWESRASDSRPDPARSPDGSGGSVPAVASPDIAAEFIVEVGRLTREREFPSPVSTPDAIAAVQLTKQLAVLRGHATPTREDLLDGIRSCFVKGEVQTEGRLVMNLILEVLAGNQVGSLPPDAGVPPIVEDFRRQSRELRLPVDSVDQRELALDLYRIRSHRKGSRLFHRLELLEVPYASFVSGPDFVRGVGLELMQEHWRVMWSPRSEGALIEASVYGPTIEDAATAKLQELVLRLNEDAQGRSTIATVRMLIRACRMGLHAQMRRLVPLIDEHIAEDSQLPSVVEGLSQLELLLHSREPLEAHDLTEIPDLMQAAYRRACRLLDTAAKVPDEAVDDVLQALSSLREILAAASPIGSGMDDPAVSEARASEPSHKDDSSAPPPSLQQSVLSGGEVPEFDPALFHDGLRRVIADHPHEAQAAVVGAAAGILFGEGKLTEQELIEIACGYLRAATLSPQKSSGIVRGLLATARETAWHLTELIRAVDETFSGWSDDQFQEALPELRLAFADLTPREINRVAGKVAGLHKVDSLGELIHTDLDEADVQLAIRLNQRVKESLQSDGLN